MQILTRLTLALVALACSSLAAAAQPAYPITVDTAPQGAAVYLEAKEAGVQGHTPHTFKLRPGTYTLIFEAEGCESLTRVIKVTKKASFKFSLVKLPAPGVLSVAADSGGAAQGAAVKINGKEVGVVPVKVSLQPGRYLLEVSRPGFDMFQKWLDMQGGDTLELPVALTKSAAQTGTLLVSSNVHGAEVYLDGRRQPDAAPTLIEQVSPGKHVIEVRAAGHLPESREVEARPAETIKVELLLKPDPALAASETGTLMILCSEVGARIKVDGKASGEAPVKVQGLVPGSHLVEARKEGFLLAEQTVEIGKGEFKTIKLKLAPTPEPRKSGALRVVGPIRGVMVFIDGTLAGKTPLLRHQLDPGPHFVTLRASGYEEQLQTVEVKAGKIVELQARMSKVATSTDSPTSQPTPVDGDKSAREQPISTLGLSSFGAHLVPPSYFTADVSFGFPHIFEGRLTAGLLNRGDLGLDGGVEFRTYGAMSEIGLHTKLRLLQRSAFALGVLFTFGGGGGPASRNTIYANLGVVASMWFKKMVTFSGRAYFNFYSDRHCPGDPESGELSPLCRSPSAAGVDGLESGDMRERFNGTRFILSAALEVPVHRRFNLFAIFEGAPFQGNRRAYTDAFAGVMPDEDPAAYGRIGGTFKY